MSKDMLYLSQQIDRINQKLDDMQKKVDAETQDIRNLVDQANRNVTAMQATFAQLQKATDQSLASSGARFDSMTSQLQALTESLEEAKSRLTKLSEQVAQTQNILQTINSPSAPGGPATLGPGASVPDADTLFKSANSYYQGGQFQLAVEAFQQYLQYYGKTDRASEAQYYIGECYYSLKNYAQAVKEYNACLERYPRSGKEAAAQLKKGYALLAMSQQKEGIQELRSVAQRFPNSHEADLARQRLRQLGVSVPQRHGE